MRILGALDLSERVIKYYERRDIFCSNTPNLQASLINQKVSCPTLANVFSTINSPILHLDLLAYLLLKRLIGVLF